MTTVASDFPVFRAYDSLGNPLVGGQLFTYQAGTTTPLVTYSDAYGNTPNTNPVILDSTGSAVVYLGEGLYKFVLEDVNSVVQWTQDNVFGFSYTSPAMAPVQAAPTLAAALALLGGVTAAQVLALIANSSVPTGTIMDFGGQLAPSGYLACDGSLVSRTTYSALFLAIGTAFGAGDGSTTFALPDFRGYFSRGWDNGAGVDPGRVLGSTQADAVGPHNHPITDSGHTHPIAAYTNVSGSVGVPSGSPIDSLTTATGSATTGITVNNNTGTTETIVKNVAVLKIIKT